MGAAREVGRPGRRRRHQARRSRGACARAALGAAFFAVFTPGTLADNGQAAHVAFELSDLIDRVVAEHPRDFVAATSVAEIRAAHRSGRIAILKGIEGGHAIEDSLGLLRDFYRLGVRYMTLTHTNTNNWADSLGNFTEPNYDPAKWRKHGGLTAFGKEVVAEMNRLGMAVDVSHVSPDTLRDVLAVVQGAAVRLALVVPRADRQPAQPHRRADRAIAKRRRRRHDQRQLVVPRRRRARRRARQAASATTTRRCRATSITSSTRSSSRRARSGSAPTSTASAIRPRTSPTSPTSRSSSRSSCGAATATPKCAASSARVSSPTSRASNASAPSCAPTSQRGRNGRLGSRR